jgi:hypothetical protein
MKLVAFDSLQMTATRPPDPVVTIAVARNPAGSPAAG